MENLPALPAGLQVTAWQAGDGQPVEPRTAMILLLHVSWQRWHFYAALLRAQALLDSDSIEEPDGLVGHHYGMSSNGPYAQSEEIRALVKLEAAERDRCARLAKQAHDMGIVAGDPW